MNRVFSRLGLTALSLVAGSALYAQNSTGGLVGHVTDQATGASKAGVTVSVDRAATGFHRVVTTDANGNYRLPALAVGDYTLTFTSGDQHYTINTRVVLGTDTGADFKFPTSATSTVVVTSNRAPVDAVNVTSAEVGVNVNSEILNQLPILDRNINSAAVIAPGVQVIPGANVDPTKHSSTYIVSGVGQGRGTNFNIDGGDNNSTDVGGYVFQLPLEAVDQFQVVTNQYKAEFGKSNAGFLNVVSKSGTNDFGGVVNVDYTNQSMRARRTDEGTKSSNNRTDYEVMVSGPIIKDKLFYLVDYSDEKASAPSLASGFDPRSVAAFPQLGGINVDEKHPKYYVRLDWNIMSNWNMMFSGGYNKDEQPNQPFPRTGTFLGYVTPSSLGTSLNKTKRYQAKSTYTMDHFVWESTITYFDYTNEIDPSFTTPNNGLDVSVQNAVTPNSPLDPGTSNTPGSFLYYAGNDPNASQNTGIKRTDWRNDLTYYFGDHIIKGGIDYQKQKYANSVYFWRYPSVDFTVAGVSLANAYSQSVQANTNVLAARFRVPIIQPPLDATLWGVYIQDDWTINQNWSVYLGARVDWDNQLAYLNQFDYIYQQSHAINPQFLNGSEAPRDKKYFQPRFQVLFKPNGDDTLVFKLGAGRFIANTIANVIGFAAAGLADVNGMPTRARNAAARTAQGLSNAGVASLVANFSAGTTITTVNGVPLTLGADFTPYNFINNVGGDLDLFRVTAAGALSPENATTGGKQLLQSDFQYPTTDTLTLGGTFKFNEHHSLDVTLLYSKTRHATTYFTSDGSTPGAYSPDPSAQVHDGSDDLGDSLFVSNQTASQRQVQMKYQYTGEHSQFIATAVAQDMRSSYGGSVGAFDGGSGGADFYGAGITYPWLTGPERRAGGTESFLGSFSWIYNMPWGTNLALLGQWHSGKAYDVSLGVNANNPTQSPTDAASVIPVVGFREGAWNADVSVRLSQDFKFMKRFTVTPFVQISNILNNYDYGNAFDGTLLSTDGQSVSYNSDFAQRLRGIQTNNPRTAEFGFRFTF